MLDNGLAAGRDRRRAAWSPPVYDLERRAASPSPPGRAATCSSCTPTSRTSGTPGTSTRSTATPSGRPDRRPSSVRRGGTAASGGPGGASAHSRVTQMLPAAPRAPSGSTSTPRSTGTRRRSSSRRRSRSTCAPSVSTSETQFGHVHRPTHTNTSWEAAKFEICAHRFLHVDEPGYGVALVNDSTYGHDVTRTVRATTAGRRPPSGSPCCAPRASPTRRPTRASTASGTRLVLGAGIGDAVRGATASTCPSGPCRGERARSRRWSTSTTTRSWSSAVKLADDRSGDVVVRLYEAHGGRARASISTSFAHTRSRRPTCWNGPWPTRRQRWCCARSK